MTYEQSISEESITHLNIDQSDLKNIENYTNHHKIPSTFNPKGFAQIRIRHRSTYLQNNVRRDSIQHIRVFDTVTRTGFTFYLLSTHGRTCKKIKDNNKTHRCRY